MRAKRTQRATQFLASLTIAQAPGYGPCNALFARGQKTEIGRQGLLVECRGSNSVSLNRQEGLK
ncbi:hypothetical protein AFL94_09395 [Arthrobacter sp. LS16]|nr:hypothetical protein AFL94_09395 [Arthrobacter sp. LS16]